MMVHQKQCDFRVPVCDSGRYSATIYRANPFTRMWEYWSTHGWTVSEAYKDTPITPAGAKIVRRTDISVVSYSRTWAEPVEYPD